MRVSDEQIIAALFANGTNKAAATALGIYKAFFESAGDMIDRIFSEMGRDDWFLQTWGTEDGIMPEARRVLCGIPQLERGEVAPSSAFEFSFTGVR